MSARVISVPQSLAEINDVEFGTIHVDSIDTGNTVIASIKKLLATDGYVFVPNTKATSNNSTNCVSAVKGVKFQLGHKVVVNIIMYRTRMGLLHVDIQR